MSDVLIKATGQVLYSVHTPDYLTADYIINPTEQEITDHQPPFDLDNYKAIKNGSIDMKTAQLIVKGYDHNGNTISTSPAAQSNWNSIINKINLGEEITEPYPLSTKQNTKYMAADKNEVKAVFLGGFNMIEGYIQSGQNLKESVLNAADKAAVDAVVDDRS